MTTCNSTLDIQYVGDNKGNSGSKKQYEFKYSPDILDFKPIDTGLKISLSPKTSKDIIIVGYKTSCTSEIFANDIEDKRVINIPGEYEKGAVYNLSIFVLDSNKENNFNCDPQVRNSKPPT